MEYKEIIDYERKLYFSNKGEQIVHFLTQSNHWKIWRYIVALRKEERYTVRFKKNKLYAPFLIMSRLSKNRIGRKLCFDIPGGVFAPGLLIWHPGAIAVNPNARVGKNAVIVGNLCIGNNNGVPKAPKIGDNCVFGWDSAVIGNVSLGDNCIIGAKALVNKTFMKDSILVGIPARNMKD